MQPKFQKGDRILYKTPSGNLYDSEITDLTPDGKYIYLGSWELTDKLVIVYHWPRQSFWQWVKSFFTNKYYFTE